MWFIKVVPPLTDVGTDAQNVPFDDDLLIRKLAVMLMCMC